MPFGRRKHVQRGRHFPKGDPFDHLADEREEAESTAWFLEPDEGPDLEIEAGISSNLRDDDVDRSDPA